MFYTTPISVISEPAKVSFCILYSKLFNEVEANDGGSARVQQDEIEEILVLEPQRSGDCFAHLMGSIDSSALHVLPSVR